MNEGPPEDFGRSSRSEVKEAKPAGRGLPRARFERVETPGRDEAVNNRSGPHSYHWSNGDQCRSHGCC